MKEKNVSRGFGIVIVILVLVLISVIIHAISSENLRQERIKNIER